MVTGSSLYLGPCREYAWVYYTKSRSGASGDAHPVMSIASIVIFLHTGDPTYN